MINNYSGYFEIQANDELHNEVYVQPFESETLLPLINQYAIIYNPNGSISDTLKFNGAYFEQVPYKSIDNKFSGKIKPRNPQQRLLLSLLYDKNITIKVVSGKFGSGKSYLMIASALDLIQNGKFDKIIWVRNNIEVKNTKPIGYLPGDSIDKLLPFAMPLADHVGGEDQLRIFMERKTIEVQHLGFIRGRDIKNSIIICSEAENLTKEHVQLLIGRVGEGSQLWLDGDLKQTDEKIFEENNGLRCIIEKLKGHPLFGYIKLIKSERSQTAALADLLD